MKRFEPAARGAREQRGEPPPRAQRSALSYGHHGRYIGVLALVILVLITINTALTNPNGAKGIEPGRAVPPFAAPLATASLNGDVNVATRPHEGQAGSRPACTVRGAGVLNVCELYERGPLVLALFVAAGSCEGILTDMQTLAGEFHGVSFAAVAIRGDHASVSKLVRKRSLTRLTVGVDRDGALVPLYKVASCPQVTFVLPGGTTQGAALLSRPSPRTLRARVAQLLAAAEQHGWRQSRR